MFAPAIGVPEDITNANGVGCVAAHLLSMLNGGAVGAVAEVEVDQGDVLGFPGTVLAAATSGSTGIRVRVGGVVALPGCP